MVSEFPQNGTQNENQESETNAKPSSSTFTWAGESDIIMSDSTDEWIDVENNKQKKKDKGRKDKRKNLAKHSAKKNSNIHDGHFVTSGWATGITGEKLTQWLEVNGLKVSECTLLTKHKDPRYLTYKITIPSKDIDKAMNLGIWPENVKVQKFEKNFGIQKRKEKLSRENTNLEQLQEFRQDIPNVVYTVPNTRMLSSTSPEMDQQPARPTRNG